MISILKLVEKTFGSLPSPEILDPNSVFFLFCAFLITHIRSQSCQKSSVYRRWISHNSRLIQRGPVMLIALRNRTIMPYNLNRVTSTSLERPLNGIKDRRLILNGKTHKTTKKRGKRKKELQNGGKNQPPERRKNQTPNTTPNTTQHTTHHTHTSHTRLWYIKVAEGIPPSLQSFKSIVLRSPWKFIFYLFLFSLSHSLGLSKTMPSNDGTDGGIPFTLGLF